MRVILPSLLVLGLTACAGDDTDDETPTGTTAETGAAPTGETGMVEPVVTYSLRATITEAVPADPAMGQAPIGEGLCAALLDPSPVITGGDAEVVGTGLTDANGQITFDGITAKPNLGFLIQVDDCPDSTEDVIGISTNTGVLAAVYADAMDGDTVDAPGFGLKTTTLAFWAAEITAAGYAGDLNAGGFLFGFTLDAAGAPYAGVVVDGGGAAAQQWYPDIDPADGLFETAEALNTATSPAGLFITTDAEIGNFTATDNAGTLTFGSTLIGGFPGQAVAIGFIGTPSM